jgi:hypothetical protein
VWLPVKPTHINHCARLPRANAGWLGPVIFVQLNLILFVALSSRQLALILIRLIHRPLDYEANRRHPEHTKKQAVL